MICKYGKCDEDAGKDKNGISKSFCNNKCRLASQRDRSGYHMRRYKIKKEMALEKKMKIAKDIRAGDSNYQIARNHRTTRQIVAQVRLDIKDDFI